MRARTEAAELERRLAAARQRIVALERELEERSLQDVLTRLPVPNAFFATLEGELERASESGETLSLAVLDVDAFRAINARHGRSVGDRVLCALAERLPALTNSADFVTRSSADEFMIAFPGATSLQAADELAALLRELEELRVGPLESVSASVGVAEYVPQMTADQLVTAAAEHLRRARLNGAGRTETRGGRKGLGGDTVAGLAEALLERDHYTGEHCEVVAELATQVAWSLGLSERDVGQVRAAALLHDIGKVGIPDDILHKARDLSEAEWRTMREHPVIGERIVRAIPSLGPVARIVRHEHERFDGSGYPDGLKGDEIPIGARIVLACDAYHAMTSNRPYRSALSHAEALRELAEGAGSQFDPRVAEALIDHLGAGRALSRSADRTPA